MRAPPRACCRPMQAAGRGAASAARPDATDFRRSAPDRAGERRHDAADGTNAHRLRGGPRRATKSRGGKTGLEQVAHTHAAHPNDPIARRQDAAGHPRCLQGEARIKTALPTYDRPVTAGRMPAPPRASCRPGQAAGRGAERAARPDATDFRRSYEDRAAERRHDAAERSAANIGIRDLDPRFRIRALADQIIARIWISDRYSGVVDVLGAVGGS
jgi:hypothetical protein